MIDGLSAELSQFRKALVAGAEERKAVVRCFLRGIRIEKGTRQAILEWYRLPRPSFLKMVELRRVELDPFLANVAVDDKVLPLPGRSR